ncbi:MAG: type II CAAX endopeptidase family protein [Anaerolineales bacterium]
MLKNTNHDNATDDRRVVIKGNMQVYLDLVRDGKNNWWRYVLAVLLILFMWQILGSLPSVALFMWERLSGGNRTGISLGDSAGTAAGFVALMLASVFFMSGIYFSMRFIHRRPFRTLITPTRAIAWGRLFQGFGVWFVLAALMSVVEALLYPGRYVWTLDMRQFIPFIFLVLILVPIQTSAEELFFRGYILQGFGVHLRNIWVLSGISGLLFGIPHLLNPEASVNYPLLGLYYFAFGFFLAYITLQDGRLELALGAHAANNLFSVLIANYTVSVLPSPSLFTITVLDAVYSVPAALIGMAIFVYLFFRPWLWKTSVE